MLRRMKPSTFLPTVARFLGHVVRYSLIFLERGLDQSVCWPPQPSSLCALSAGLDTAGMVLCIDAVAYQQGGNRQWGANQWSTE